MRVIFDTNIWITMLMGFQEPFFRDLFKSRKIEVYICNEIIREVHSVSFRDKFKNRIDDMKRNRLNALFSKACKHAIITKNANTQIRDSKDIYLLSFAESIQADYLVSGDKDLLVLKHHEETKIVSLSEFKSFLEFV